MMKNKVSGVVIPRPKVELMKSFATAKSVTEMLKAFQEMEASFDELDLGVHCMVLADKLLHQNSDFEKALYYGKMALRILLANVDKNKPCFGKYFCASQYGDACSHCRTPAFFISRVCLLVGTACRKLEKYDEGLTYLNWANRKFTKLNENARLCTGKCVWHDMFHTQLQLVGVKSAKGKPGEAADHMKNALEFQEKMMKKDCFELGQVNMYVYKAYLEAEDFEAALPFCLKALEMHEKHLGRDSVEVGEIRKTLASIYKVLGDGEKANVLEKSMSVMKNRGSSASRLLMGMGKYEEAIEILEREISSDDMGDDSRALKFIGMAEAFLKLGKFTDAKKRMRTAKNLLEKKGKSPLCIGIGFWELSCLYEELNDPETALSYVRKAIAVPDIPQPILSQNVVRLFTLTLRSRKVKEGIPYLEDAVEKLKDSYGPEQSEVGFGYINLGLAYWNTGQQELGLKLMTTAKDLMDATVGPNHINSLKTSQALSMTYGRMGRFAEAVNVQEKIVEGVRGLVSSDQEFVDKAVMILKVMKKGAAASLTSNLPQFSDSEVLCQTMSKCGISYARKEIK